LTSFLSFIVDRFDQEFEMSRPLSPRSSRLAFTLVELLVVIAIIGVLVALLLPAVQAAREAARRSQCMNQVKQIMLSMQNHESAKKAFPSGGFGPWPNIANYVSGPGGSPFGPDKQGVGWAFQILPYLEGQAVYNIKTMAQMETTIVPMYNCPSRRPPTTRHPVYSTQLMDYAAAVPYRSKGQLGSAVADYPYIRPTTDGTRNLGCQSQAQFWSGLNLRHEAEFNNQANITGRQGYAAPRGVIVRSGYCGSCTPEFRNTGMYTRIGFNQITDGSSNTMVVGEKWVDTALLDVGTWNDDRGWSDGWDPDALRANLCGMAPDKAAVAGDPIPALEYGFGSSHTAGMNTGFADASVRFLNYDIDLEIFNRLGNRDDDELIDSGVL
jgi:prepilin-type N-terminal cleavage/methylation domain-containing protein